MIMKQVQTVIRLLPASNHNHNSQPYGSNIQRLQSVRLKTSNVLGTLQPHNALYRDHIIMKLILIFSYHIFLKIMINSSSMLTIAVS